MSKEPQEPKIPRTGSPLEAAYCAAWNAMHAAKNDEDCMVYCTRAGEFCHQLPLNEAKMIWEKIGAAQRKWGLQ